MRVVFLIALTILCIPLTGITSGHTPDLREAGEKPVPSPTAADWSALIKKAYSHFQRHEYTASLSVIEKTLPLARQYPSSPLALTTEIYAGNFNSMLWQDSQALRWLLSAKRKAAKAGNRKMEAVIAHSLSGIYFRSKSFDQASLAADEAVRALPLLDPTWQIQVLTNKGRILIQLGQPEQARQIFLDLARRADFVPAPSTRALVWTYLGYAAFVQQDWDTARSSYEQAFRILKLAKDPEVAAAYRNLALLRLTRGDPQGAKLLYDAALAADRKNPSLLTRWSAFHGRGRAQLALGRETEALQDFQSAILEIHHTRQHLLPSDSLQVQHGAGVSEAYTDYIDTACGIYRQTGDARLNRKAFAVAEAARAFSLRNSLGLQGELRRQLPPAYWETLRKFQDAYARLYRSGADGDAQNLKILQARLAELEAARGLGPGAELVDVLSGESSAPPLPPAGEAILFFHFGSARSHLWIGTSTGWELTFLPPRAELSPQFEAFAKAVREGSAQAQPIGSSLYLALFGGLNKTALGAGTWRIVPDAELYDVPLAALVAGYRGNRPEYLVEQHDLRLVAGLGVKSTNADHWQGPWIGIGDPIYNSADPRLSAPSIWKRSRKIMENLTKRTQTLGLARLPATHAELENSQRLWSGPGQSAGFLEGVKATGSVLEESFALKPRILHFATHVLPAPQAERESLIALSLLDDGTPEFIGPEWIAARNIRCELIIMSGCRSGRGEIKPGEGLMGLSRAWLFAGAGSVLATQWPVVDDAGHLLAAFYREWHQSGAVTPAQALRKAQLEMLSQKDWRAEPKYWAAYFLATTPAQNYRIH